MVFPQHNYTHIPYDGLTQQQINDLINAAYKYCQNVTDIYEFEGKCKPSDLPSFHPYWGNQGKQSIDATLREDKSTLGGFQAYLVDRGWKRYTQGYKGIEENYTSDFISTYGPIEYFFSHTDYPGKILFYGLEEKDKPPYMNLGNIRIGFTNPEDIYQSNDKTKIKTRQDVHTIAVMKLSPDIIYDAIINDKPIII